MSSRHAEVLAADSGDVTHAGTTDVGFAEATHVGYAKTPHVTSANATDVTSTKAAHVAATKAATMSAAAAATAAGLRTRGCEAAGKQRGCQNHHQSSFHNLSPLGWRTFRRRTFVRCRRSQRTRRRRRDRLEGGITRPPSPLNSPSIIRMNIGHTANTLTPAQRSGFLGEWSLKVKFVVS
jgi:hypothetical protein